MSIAILRFCFLLLVFVARAGYSDLTFAQTDVTTLSIDGCGRATAYSKTNKIVTVGDKTHVAWLDSDENGFVVRIRTLNQQTQKWSKTFDIGRAVDNHGGPSLAVDSDNYLHVVYGPHHHPMSYRKSIRPNEASEWSIEEKFGERLTYPSLMVCPDNMLIVVCRMSFSDKPWCVVAHTKKSGESWSKPTKLLTGGQPGYSQFHVSLAWGPDHKTLHLATRMYGDTPRWGYKVGYMKSNDFAAGWLTHDDLPIKLPATRATIDTIYETPVEQRAEHNSGSAVAGGLIAVDSGNVPHVLYHSLQSDGSIPHQAWIAFPGRFPGSNGGWSRMSLNEKISVRTRGASLSTPGGFSIATDESWHLALTMTENPQSAESPFGSNNNEVVWARSFDRGKTFESRLISEPNQAYPNWLPNIERSTGFNQVQNPAIIFTSGPKGAKLTDRLNNRVIWFRPKD